MTGRPDHACSRHSSFSSHHDDTGALGNRVPRKTTATRQNKPPSNASKGSGERPLSSGGNQGSHCYQISQSPTGTTPENTAHRPESRKQALSSASIQTKGSEKSDSEYKSFENMRSQCMEINFTDVLQSNLKHAQGSIFQNNGPSHTMGYY